MKHITVFQKEVGDLLKVKEDGIYADLTLGGGGHSLDIINALKTGTLFTFDLDKKAIENFNQELKILGFKTSKSTSENVLSFKKQSVTVNIVNDNFVNLKNYSQEQKLDGIIADLGWSSDQLENLEGLSHSNDEMQLDMRFDGNLGVKASDLLNALNKKELGIMFKEYADIYGGLNDQLVQEIINQRQVKLFETVGDLKASIDRLFKRSGNKNSFYSKVFQALRIAVNQELTNLKIMLTESFEALNQNGMLLVITFHSGESKIVQNFFDEKIKNQEATCLTKKLGENFLTPTVDELKRNINARSAKLFGVVKAYGQ